MRDQEKTKQQLISELESLRKLLDRQRQRTGETWSEEALRESEEKYHAMVEAFDGLIYICSEDYRVEFMNEKLIQRTGYDATGDLCYKALHDLDSICPWCVNEEVFKGKTVRWEVQSPKDNRWYYVVNTPIYYAEGRMSKQAMILDITERKQIEEALRESEQKYRSLTQNIPSIVYRGYKDSSVEFIDNKIELLTGYGIEDFNSKNLRWYDIILEEDIGAVKEAFIDAIQDDRYYVREYRISTEKGKIVWIQERGHIICDDSGEVQYIDGTFYDITYQKKAEKALEDSMKKLKLFAYSVMHDLKSPTISIHGLIKHLQNKYKDVLDERGRKYCDQIVKVSEHIASLIENINVYIAARELPLKLEGVDIKGILHMVSGEFSDQLESRGVRWTEPEDIPLVVADRLLLQRVFQNFVDNALKYGGEALSEISIDYEETYKFHIFSVADNGEGFKGAVPDDIFDLFKAGHRSDSIKGTGIGLAIINEIAEKHEGFVWAEPGADKGAVFYISTKKELMPT